MFIAHTTLIPLVLLFDSVPTSLNNLASYTTSLLPEYLDHPALRGSLVVLPGLGDVYGQNLPTLPSVHNGREDYPFTQSVPHEHIHVSEHNNRVTVLPQI
mgnify:CR=1 FL=1